jgi:hypothetical protein
MYAGRQRGRLRTLLPGLTGYLASVAALIGTDGIEDTCAALPQVLRDYELRTRTPFSQRIHTRRLQAAFT